VCWQALNIDESILCLDGGIRLSLHALDINITVHIYARSILLHLLSSSSHILRERLQILLFAQVDWLFVVANLFDLSACCNICETKIVLVQLLVDCASDLDILTEMEFLAHGPCKANSIHGFQSLDHSSNGAQTTGDISLGFWRPGTVASANSKKNASRFLVLSRLCPKASSSYVPPLSSTKSNYPPFSSALQSSLHSSAEKPSA
jgi:hypothetical protein